MADAIRLFLMGSFLAAIQGSLAKSWVLSGPAPDFFLLFLIWLGMSGRTGTALILAFLGGIVEDSAAEIYTVGVHSLARVFVAYLPEWSRLILVQETRGVGYLLVLAGTVLQTILILSILKTLSPDIHLGGSVVYDLVYSIILNCGVWFLASLLLIPARRPEYAG